MRVINKIIIHCSATEENKDFDAKDIKKWHLEKGFNDIGYHYVIKLDGTVEEGRNVEVMGAHCQKYNEASIGICYVGGLKDGKPHDTRTINQKEAMILLVKHLKKQYNINNKEIYGHNYFNKNKDCPCFKVVWREFC